MTTFRNQTLAVVRLESDAEAPVHLQFSVIDLALGDAAALDLIAKLQAAVKKPQVPNVVYTGSTPAGYTSDGRILNPGPNQDVPQPVGGDQESLLSQDARLRQEEQQAP